MTSTVKNQKLIPYLFPQQKLQKDLNNRNKFKVAKTWRWTNTSWCYLDYI